MIWVWGEVLLWFFFFFVYLCLEEVGKGMKEKRKNRVLSTVPTTQAHPGVGRNSEYVL